MLGILLLVLKIIGLILLGILGLFLMVLLLILFMPVSYRVWVSGDSGDFGQLAYRVKIFGIQILPKKERKKRFGRKRRGKPKEAIEKPDADHEKTEALPAWQERPEAPKAVESELAEEEVMEPQTPKLPGEETEKPELPDQKAVASETPEKILPARKNLKKRGKRPEKEKKQQKESAKKREKSASMADVRGIFGQVRTELTDEGNRRALTHVLSEIRYLLRHFGPRHLRGDLSFSLGEPANTGYATAGLALCPFSYGKDCHIRPDFEAEQLYLRGWMEVNGHVRTVHVLLLLLRLLLDKDIRKIMKKVLHQKKK